MDTRAGPASAAAAAGGVTAAETRPDAQAAFKPGTRRTWVAAHDRRVHAAGVARRLQPAAVRLGGYATSRLRVCLDGQPERRPLAALAAGAPPVDGVTTEAPLLVVEPAGSDPKRWLAAGSAEVWLLGRRVLTVHRAGAEPVVLRAEDKVAVPQVAGLRLGVYGLLPRGRP